jgi:hypothetical protein
MLLPPRHSLASRVDIDGAIDIVNAPSGLFTEWHMI